MRLDPYDHPLTTGTVCDIIIYGKLTRERKIIAGFFVIFLLAHSFGGTDFLFETSFDDFRWPNSVRTENMTGNNSIRFYPVSRSQQETNVIYVFINSFVGNFKTRQTLRETWAQRKVHMGYEVLPIFVIGSYEEEGTNIVNKAVRTEYEKHGDMLVLETVDSYRNNTYKFIQTIWYANEMETKVSAPDFIVLIRDDYYLHIPALVFHVLGLDRNVYEGFVFHSTPNRFRLHEQHVELHEYPYDRYPPYVTAGAVVLSQKTVKQFSTFAGQIAYFPYDDIFAGIVAYLSGVEPTHSEKFVYWSQDVSVRQWMRLKYIAVHGYSASKIRELYAELHKKHF